MRALARPPVRVENVRARKFYKTIYTKFYKKIYKYYKTILIKFSKTFPRKLFPNYKKSKERGRWKVCSLYKKGKKGREKCSLFYI